MREEMTFAYLEELAGLCNLATKRNSVSISVNRCAKEAFKPQKYEVAFERGTHYDSSQLDGDQAGLVLERIYQLILMMAL